MIDCHCHLEYIENLDDVIREAKQKGMKALLTSACDPKHFSHAIEMQKKYHGFVLICIGFHPEIMKDYSDEDIYGFIDRIRANKSSITAIGEIGLDYNWNVKEEDQVRSRDIFAKFIELAKELDLPIIVHSRNGQNNAEGRNEGIADALEILTKHHAKKVMLHCFSGNEANLKFALSRGWLISYATVLVKSFKHQRLAGETPLENMLLETDSPWLDPDSRELVNRPWKIERTAEIVAQKKGTTKEEVLRATAENARAFFKL